MADFRLRDGAGLCPWEGPGQVSGGSLPRQNDKFDGFGSNALAKRRLGL